MTRPPLDNLLTNPQRDAYAALKRGPLYRTAKGFEGERTRAFSLATIRSLEQIGLVNLSAAGDAAVLSARARRTAAPPSERPASEGPARQARNAMLDAFNRNERALSCGEIAQVAAEAERELLATFDPTAGGVFDLTERT